MNMNTNFHSLSAKNLLSLLFSRGKKAWAEIKSEIPCDDNCCGQCGPATDNGGNSGNGHHPFGLSFTPTFLRHVRQEVLVDGGNQIQISPTGGLTFLITLNPAQKKIRFSFAVCSERDLFSKKVAASICKTRMHSGQWYELVNYRSDISAVENIYFAIENYLISAQNNDNITTPKLSLVPTKVRVQELSRIAQFVKDNYTLLSSLMIAEYGVIEMDQSKVLQSEERFVTVQKTQSMGKTKYANSEVAGLGNFHENFRPNYLH